jgi:hypothetical protein
VLKVYNPGIQVIDPLQSWPVESSQDSSLPIAAVHVLYNHPTRWPGTQVQKELPHIYTASFCHYQHVLLTAGESYTTQDIQQWIDQNHLISVSVAQGTKPTQGWQDQDHWFYRPYWLPHFLKSNPELSPLPPTGLYIFDALLGARRPHRDYVMQQLTTSGLLQHSVVTYRDCFPGGNNENAVDFEWPYVSKNLDPAWEVADNINNLISFSTPWQIYQHTRYSIVCETIGDGPDFFFTEKTMKVLWAQRVFVMFGVQYFLKNLHDLGFQTFGNILDESYDAIADHVQRRAAAWKAAEQLTLLDYDTVLSITQSAREHNHSRMVELEKEMQAKAQYRLDVISTQTVL